MGESINGLIDGCMAKWTDGWKTCFVCY